MAECTIEVVAPEDGTDGGDQPTNGGDGGGLSAGQILVGLGGVGFVGALAALASRERR